MADLAKQLADWQAEREEIHKTEFIRLSERDKDRMACEIHSLLDQADSLARLIKYSQHDEFCESFEGLPCDCGLDKLIAEIEGKPDGN